MEKALYLNGKKYISAKRAALLVGYTSDYVGQLARGSKLEATLFGRSWYVEEASILDHKANSKVSSYPAKNKKSNKSQFSNLDELSEEIKDKKLEISAVPAKPVSKIKYIHEDEILFPKLSRKIDLEAIKASAFRSIDSQIEK